MPAPNPLEIPTRQITPCTSFQSIHSSQSRLPWPNLPMPCFYRMQTYRSPLVVPVPCKPERPPLRDTYKMNIPLAHPHLSRNYTRPQVENLPALAGYGTESGQLTLADVPVEDPRQNPSAASTRTVPVTSGTRHGPNALWQE